MVSSTQKYLIAALIIIINCLFATTVIADETAKKFTWQPTAGHQQIPIWPVGKMPDSIAQPKAEYAVTVTKPLVAGKPWIAIYHVSEPTMTIYSPRKHNTGAAVIVFPGGGFKILAIDLEGTEICHWLTSKGITCVLLKYRVPNSGPAWDKSCHCHIHPKAPTALQDAQRTVGLVRFNAAKWHINPNKIGIIGFSAGGYMVADLSTHFAKRAYKPIDGADKVSCRPDFAMAIYPGHMQTDGKPFQLNPNIHFTKDTPPTFIVQAEDDPEDNIDNALLYYLGLKNAGVPVEMHLYAHGGHAFGLRPTQYPITRWPKLADIWLLSIGE